MNSRDADQMDLKLAPDGARMTIGLGLRLPIISPTMEMWFLRRMLRVSWTEKRTNLEILNTASSTRKLMNNIKRRQAEFLGHVMRKGKLEHLLTTGKIEGKRSRGRQRIKIQDGIAAWLGRSTAEMFVDARDRKKWKVMIAYACNRHGN